MTLSASAADQQEPLSCASYRRALFRGLRLEESYLRSATLDLISKTVEKWSKEFYLNGGLSNTPPPSAGGMLQRSNSSKLGLEFDDVFEDDLSVDQQPSGVDSAVRSPEIGHEGPPTPGNEDRINEAFDKYEQERANGSPESSRMFKLSYSSGSLYKFDDATGRDLRASLEGFRDETLTFEEMNSNLKEYYLTLLRLSMDCPFQDVRSECKHILKRLKNAGAELPDVRTRSPSYLIPVHETIGFEPANAAKQVMTREMGADHPALSPSSSMRSLMNESDDEEDLSMSPAKEAAAGITIPIRGHDRTRSQSRTRTPAGSMPGRGGRRGAGERSLTSSLNHVELASPLSPIDYHLKSNIRRKFKQATTALNNQKMQGKPLPANAEVHQFQQATFASEGRFTNMNKLLSFFPSFAAANSRVVEVLMNSSGSCLPRSWKFYLGIMAAAEHKCQYYISLLTSNFLDCGGNRAWLKGLSHAHPKLQRVKKLNTVLAHQPWRLDPLIIRELVKGIDEEGHKCEANGDCHNWSTTEIVHAVTILSYYHCQSALALGLGVVPEADTPGGYMLPNSGKCQAILPMTPVHLPAAALSAQTGDPSMSPINSFSELKNNEDSYGSPSGLSILSRKRQQLSSSVEKSEKTSDGPDKWLKTPNGSVPTSISSRPSTAARPSTGNRPPSHQKRRKSFEECAASDDDPPPTLVSTTTSYSAPTSYIPASTLNNHPLGVGREFFLSPSSSTSSLFECGQKVLQDQMPVNILVEDCERFLQIDERAPTIYEDFDVNSQEYSFLPMEDFDWDRNACEIIGEYQEGLEDVFDEYFKRVQEIHDEVFDEDSGMTGSGYISGTTSRVGSIFSPGPHPSFYDFDEQQQHGGVGATGESFYSMTSHHLSSPSYTFHSADSSFSTGPNTSSSSSDVKPLKEAVWFYSLRLLGIQKDDYPYSDVKVLLPKGARSYLKRVCTMPELVTPRDWRGVNLNLRSEDMVLMCLLATQARFMGELLYGVKAVSEYREHAH